MKAIVAQGWMETFFLEWQFFQDLFIFLVATVLASVAIGFISNSVAIGSMSGYLVFSHLAIETGNAIFMSMFYTITVSMLVIMGLRIWSYSTEGGGV